MIKAQVEYTDTYGGEANYSWVKNFEVEGKSELAIIRKAKAYCGLVGRRCRKTDYGDFVSLAPTGMATIIFISDFETVE